jgi:hypothetical protein
MNLHTYPVLFLLDAASQGYNLLGRLVAFWIDTGEVPSNTRGRLMRLCCRKRIAIEQRQGRKDITKLRPFRLWTEVHSSAPKQRSLSLEDSSHVGQWRYGRVGFVHVRKHIMDGYVWLSFVSIVLLRFVFFFCYIAITDWLQFRPMARRNG